MTFIKTALYILILTAIAHAQLPPIKRMPLVPSMGTKGLAIVISFTDTPHKNKRAPSAIESMYNQPGYARYGNNGSIRDYFIAVSNGALDISHTVIHYIAEHPKEYYDYHQHLSEQHTLLDEVLEWLTNGTGIDPSLYDSDANGIIDALTLLYADTPTGNWGDSLWPHVSTLEHTLSWNDHTVDRYAVIPLYTHSIGQLTIGTICHELGHLLFDWPDIISSNTSAANHIGLMGTGLNPSNPLPPSPLYRSHEGWSSTHNLPTNYDTTITLSTQFNAPIYTIQNPKKPGEYLILEYRKQEERHAASNMTGLLIYHIAPVDSSLCQSESPCFPKTTLLDQNNLYWEDGTEIPISFSLGRTYGATLSLTIESTIALPELPELPTLSTPLFSLTQTENTVTITSTTDSPFTVTIFSLTGIELVSNTVRSETYSIEKRNLFPGINHLYIKGKNTSKHFAIGQW
ncbi:MAG: M6 family metalloprotease domain-containing protein [Fibrobacterales bacterium]